MRINNYLDVIYTHTEGAPTAIIHSGITYPVGSDILAKRLFLETQFDWMRRAIMLEPRGHRDMYGVFLTPPSSPDADAGMIWIDSTGFMNMCGHGTIGVAMAMVANGLVPAVSPVTTIRLETTVGLVEAEVEVRDGEALSCKFRNVPAFCLELDVPVDLGEFGEGRADIAFGGNFFGLVRWNSEHAKIDPANTHIFRRIGREVKKELNARGGIVHPVHKHINHIDVVTFYHEPDLRDATYRNVHVFADGQIGRSPGGTGVSAMMAMYEARGEISINGRVKAEGPLGGIFEGELLGEEKLGEQRALHSTVKGKANIYGFAKWQLDESDPVGAGFLMT